MADENNAGAVAEIAVTDTPVKVRRTRGPNKPKPTVDAAKVTSAEVQTAPVKTAAVRRRKQVETEGVASTSKDTLKATASKPVAKRATAKSMAAKSAAVKPAASTGDEFADLIQLEEENKMLRKALADKLRKENSDLRGRLGLA